MPDMIQDETLRALFRTESEEHLQHLDDALLWLEQAPGDQARLEEAFREAHSLKGAARMLGLGSIQVMAHRLEDVLNTLRTSGGSLDADTRIAMTRDLAELRRRVAEATGRPGSPLPSVTASAPPSAPLSAPLSAAGTAPLAEPLPNPAYHVDSVRVDTRRLDDLLVDSAELMANQTRMAARLEDMDSLIEQLETAARAVGNVPGTAWLPRLEAALARMRDGHALDCARMEKLCCSLQDAVGQMRLLPLAHLFRQFPRLVHDLAGEQGKRVELVVEGEDTRVDKRILEEIKDPLTHMLRNAVDHGIEAPEERLQAGKRQTGRLGVRARQDAGQILIEVGDDGRGLHEAAIREAAQARGLLTPEALAKLSPGQVHDLIFAPGLSTRAFVTDVSGRGVGMDVVRANVARLKGAIEVTSQPGQGTRFTLRLPVSLATQRILQVKVGGHSYGLPADAVAACRSLRAEEMFSLEGQPAALFLERPTSLAPLARLLHLPETCADASRPCVFLRLGETVFGLLVDETVDELEVVLKPLGGPVGQIPLVSGAALLNNGDICMVLDAPVLLASLMLAGVPVAGPEAAGGTGTASSGKPRKRILLAEDSITTRAQETRILESAGYEVVATANGLDALRALGTRSFDAVVSDINMPHMDGLELAGRIRRMGMHADLPIILVTSLASDADKKRGLEVGANAYITKPEFDQRLLLECLERLIG